MRLTSNSFSEGAAIPGEFCFAVIDLANHVALSTNRNPQLAWSDVPEGTKSFALICHDPDVPSKGDDVNQEGREVPASLPRVNFYHWLLWGIPASAREIAAGAQSDGVTARGKSGPETPGGMRHGINSYTGWFAGDPDMKGDYYGYDGPCPPWNDAIVHHYVVCAGCASAGCEGGIGRGECRGCAEGTRACGGEADGDLFAESEPEMKCVSVG